MHWTVVAQILPRGGLESGPKIDPTAVGRRLQQQRAQAEAEDSSNNDGIASTGLW